MPKNNSNIFNVDCSGCMEAVRVNRVVGVVVRGKHASKVLNDDGDLVTWDCPVCGHADSADLNYLAEVGF